MTSENSYLPIFLEANFNSSKFSIGSFQEGLIFGNAKISERPKVLEYYGK